MSNPVLHTVSWGGTYLAGNREVPAFWRAVECPQRALQNQATNHQLTTIP